MHTLTATYYYELVGSIDPHHTSSAPRRPTALTHSLLYTTHQTRPHFLPQKVFDFQLQ